MSFYKTNSSQQTKKIAAELAKKILKKRARKNALILALQGELGAGKTTFIQGFSRGLGIKKKITSPTFVLFKKFKIQNSKFKIVYHIDCYRIKKADELLKLGLKEILNVPQNIVLIEWAEKIRKTLPKNTIWLKFEHGQKENQRIIHI
jgi:tRNA threonylcarbamoyladenosine biosynthesis protein TsaE